MFLPLHDGKPVKHVSLQWVTLTIIALNVIVYLAVNIFGVAGEQTMQLTTIGLGHIPSISNELKVLPVELQLLPANMYYLSTITSAFLHADFFHLLGNMLFIWVFGDNVEDALGHAKYLVFYLLCAFAAATFHAFAFPSSDSPLIGASGAAAGIVAAYLMLHPKMQVWILFLSRIPLKLPAWTVLGGWIAFQVYMFVADPDGQVSWAAHVGGALAGALLVVVLKRRSVPLFDRELVVPDAVELDPEEALPPKINATRRASLPKAGSRNSSWGRNAAKKE